MKGLKKSIDIIITIILFIVFPIVVLTFITTKTSIIANIQSFIVLSGSMQPSIPVGSIVYTQQRENYNTRDIITFKNYAGVNITHRIVAINKENDQIVFKTKGDGNNTIDSTKVTQDKILGKVIIFIPYVGFFINLLKYPLYFIGFIVVPSILFILMELWNIKNEIVKMTENRVFEKLQNER